MLSQIFKIMWHRKGKNFLLLMEIFFSFLVLFITASFLITAFKNFFTPTGFDYRNVYELKMEYHGEGKFPVSSKLQTIKQLIENIPQIESYAFSSDNTPYSHTQNRTTLSTDEKEELSQHYVVDLSYQKTIDLELKEGRWFHAQDVESGNNKPAIINEYLSNKFFPGESALGKHFSSLGEEKAYTVVGVVKQFRHDGEFGSPESSRFELFNNRDTAAYPLGKILIKTKAGATPYWQQELVEKIGKVSPGWTLDLSSLSDMRSEKGKMALSPYMVLALLCAFLIFNVALGLFGVLWQNINKRYDEIGIRRALGATKLNIQKQIIGEMLMLAMMGIMAGLVLAVQFPILGVFNVGTATYILAIVFSLLLIFLLVAFCAWYPSRQASNIEPAEALHYD